MTTPAPLVDVTPPFHAPTSTPGGDEAGVVRLTKALLTLSDAAGQCTAQGRHYAGVHAVDALGDLLHATRVALVNPASTQARSLMRALARFDAIRQA